MSFFNPAWHLVKARKTVLKEQSTHLKPELKSCENEDDNPKEIAVNTLNEVKKNEPFKPKILWLNVFFITLFHLIAFYALIFKVWETKFLTIIWAVMVGGIGGFGITAGVHRLWAHRSYKAKLPLQIILLICYSVAGQNDVREWVRDHRVHHKFSETDADPHNSKRGVFFAHVGWLMQRKHPEVTRRGRTVDMSDIINDPLITLHTRYFLFLKLIFCFILPTIIPVYCWNETWKIAIASQVFVRYVTNLNFTWSVNSIAHTWGKKPYDKSIKPTQNLAVSVMAMGEGFHNYHHVFPWDYKAAELGNYSFNVTTFWLDLFAKIGWAYDLKSPSNDLILQAIKNRGDGSYIS